MLNSRSSVRLAISVLAALFIPMAATAEDLPSHPDMKFLVLHKSCNATAAKRRMSAGEAQFCAANYLRLKLSFLPDVDLEWFYALGFAERHAVNQEGYAAYLAWQNLHARRTLESDDSM
ncbi:MAG: hypothetical protein AAGK37_17875 [Pseudomonadota bacterium]